MQELLAREEEHNKRLLKPFLDEVWSGEIPKANFILFGQEGGFHYVEGCWSNCNDPKTAVTRKSMEIALLRCLRYAFCISTGGIDVGTTIVVRGEHTYISKAIDAICAGAGDDESPITGSSFLRWEDEIPLWQAIVDERLAKHPGALQQASALLRCSALWLQRMHACEEMRSRVLFPAQLALAENVCPLSE